MERLFRRRDEILEVERTRDGELVEWKALLSSQPERCDFLRVDPTRTDEPRVWRTAKAKGDRAGSLKMLLHDPHAGFEIRCGARHRQRRAGITLGCFNSLLLALNQVVYCLACLYLFSFYQRDRRGFWPGSQIGMVGPKYKA
jgi:hypothetical protein